MPQGWSKGIIPLAAKLEEMLGLGLLSLLGKVDGVKSVVKTASLLSCFPQVYRAMPTLSWNLEAPWDVPVPSHPCLPLHSGGKSSPCLLCNIFSPRLVDPGQPWRGRRWGLAAAVS